MPRARKPVHRPPPLHSSPCNENFLGAAVYRFEASQFSSLGSSADIPRILQRLSLNSIRRVLLLRVFIRGMIDDGALHQTDANDPASQTITSIGPGTGYLLCWASVPGGKRVYLAWSLATIPSLAVHKTDMHRPPAFIDGHRGDPAMLYSVK